MLSVCHLSRVLLGIGLVAFASTLPSLAQDVGGDGGNLFEPSLYDDAPPAPEGLERPAAGNSLSTRSLADKPPPLRRRRASPENPFAPQGLRAGRFLLFPTLETSVIATSNAARSSTGSEADAALRLRPGLRVASDWSRHELRASASGEVLEYLDNGELSSVSGNAQAQLRLDVRSGTRVELESGYVLTSAGPSDREVPNGAIENRVSHDFNASAAVENEGAFADLRLRGGIARATFENVDLAGGLVEDNSDRDYTEFSVSLRGTFNSGARLRPFVEAAYAPRLHDKKLDRNGLKRSSNGYSATAGLLLEGDALWSGEVAATVQVRDFEDAALDTAWAPGLLANLRWRPTELTNVDFTATLALAETASASDGATATWGAGVQAAHALRDNLTVFGGVSSSIASASSGNDVTLGARSGVEWKMNPVVGGSLAYEGSWFFADAPGGDYDDQRLIASLILAR